MATGKYQSMRKVGGGWKRCGCAASRFPNASSASPSSPTSSAACYRKRGVRIDERLSARRPEGILINPFERGEIGPDLFRAACQMGLEGLVSKRRDRPYQVGRSKKLIRGDDGADRESALA